ncbi:uncharacterized protein LOC107408069 [Ziziphus jujuba]|uniref:Uncharacterized protein LOC107408069 n=1 Tax=Ziziphus jujuba TaxID=326968 RepID=A0A6P3Z776_ZIZJJ|nr:uncharacterized protein LOC107408069 [Ziziphus jujuba]
MSAVTASTTATGPSKQSCCWRSENPRLRPAKKSIAFTKLVNHTPIWFSTKRVNPIRSLDPQKDGKEDSSAFISQEDLAYLWKLGAGSVVGAGLIKYGSIVFPEITIPNITVALVIIITPVVLAVLLLINQSRAEGPS